MAYPYTCKKVREMRHVCAKVPRMQNNLSLALLLNMSNGQSQ